MSGPGTTNVITGEVCTGLCLEPHDLCVSKLCAHRTKDLEFVRALIVHHLVSPTTIAQRLADVAEHHAYAAAAAHNWLQSQQKLKP